jgi:hypothetical protein
MESIDNINNILSLVKSSGKCNLFSTDELLIFVHQVLELFNEVAPFTAFTWEDTKVIKKFQDILVQGVIYLALAELAKITFQEASGELWEWIDGLKLIKSRAISSHIS